MRHRVFRNLTEVHEAEVGNAKKHVGQTCPGQIDRLESQIRDDACRQGVRRSRQQDAFFRGQHLPQPLDVIAH
jgi:hypothetical protein